MSSIDNLCSFRLIPSIFNFPRCFFMCYYIGRINFAKCSLWCSHISHALLMLSPILIPPIINILAYISGEDIQVLCWECLASNVWKILYWECSKFWKQFFNKTHPNPKIIIIIIIINKLNFGTLDFYYGRFNNHYLNISHVRMWCVHIVALAKSEGCQTNTNKAYTISRWIIRD
jgi:hypothetical protein